MDRPLSRKASSCSLHRQALVAKSTTSAAPSEQRTSDSKSPQYHDPRYEQYLAIAGVYMDEDDLGVGKKGVEICVDLITAEQVLVENSLFQEDRFRNMCRRVSDRNEARVVRDIAPLIVPPAENLFLYGETQLDCLIESINERWNNSIPIVGPRPQPDYSVGFRREAFTTDQLQRFLPFAGELTESSLYMATHYMYFPFLMSEVKCGTAALDFADRQNAHSTAIALRAVVELFRLVGREQELHRELLAFSISHDHRAVRIYGYYPLIDGNRTAYHRYAINILDFQVLGGKERWTAYRFVRNVYERWMPSHFRRICSAIDQLPLGVNFDVPQQPSVEPSALAQQLELQGNEEDTGAREPFTTDTSASTSAKKLKRKHMSLP